MPKIKFLTLWQKWILECIIMATTYVLVNGSPTDEFNLEIGLRQGDLLSPFIFLIAVKELHVLMNTLVEKGMYTW